MDLVLFSHADLLHIGAYPYAYTKLGLVAPVYCTFPVQNMGKMCLQDAVLTKENEEEFDIFKLNDVNAAFQRVHALRYSQPTSLVGLFRTGKYIHC